MRSSRSAIARRRARRGSSTVEFALLAPLLIVMVLWSNYFWEVLRVRIKAAEAARFIAFERTVRKDLGQITAEARSRYQDLDGATKNVALGSGFQNKLTLTFAATDEEAPLSGSLEEAGSSGDAGGMIGQVTSLIGGSVQDVVNVLGFDVSRGAVRSTVTAKLENRIIPERVGLYLTGVANNKLDVGFTETFFMYHDTWRAWEPGDNPKNHRAIVERRVRERVQDVAYMGLLNSTAGSLLSAIGTVLGLFGLEYPFDKDFVDQAVIVRGAKDDGYFPAAMPRGSRPTRTTTGDVLQAAYWQSDDNACFGSCEPNLIKNKRGLRSGAGRDDNWAMRAYKCRGPFFQGAVKSDAPESEYARGNGSAESKSYFKYASDACDEDPASHH